MAMEAIIMMKRSSDLKKFVLLTYYQERAKNDRLNKNIEGIDIEGLNETKKYKMGVQNVSNKISGLTTGLGNVGPRATCGPPGTFMWLANIFLG